jgi:hypothetical protein
MDFVNEWQCIQMIRIVSNGLGIRNFEPSCCANAVLAIVAYLLNASILEPEKQSLLANGSKTTFVPRQQIGKNVPRQPIRMQQ